jgi:hypothetical protein
MHIEEEGDEGTKMNKCCFNLFKNYNLIYFSLKKKNSVSDVAIFLKKNVNFPTWQLARGDSFCHVEILAQSAAT